MAKAITDSVALEIGRSICKPTEEWEASHHSRFIWSWFRRNGFNPEPTEAEVKAANGDKAIAAKAAVKRVAMQWDAMANNARIAYASNQAKGMAEAGVCAKPDSKAEVVAEYE